MVNTTTQTAVPHQQLLAAKGRCWNSLYPRRPLPHMKMYIRMLRYRHYWNAKAGEGCVPLPPAFLARPHPLWSDHVALRKLWAQHWAWYSPSSLGNTGNIPSTGQTEPHAFFERNTFQHEIALQSCRSVHPWVISPACKASLSRVKLSCVFFALASAVTTSMHRWQNERWEQSNPGNSRFRFLHAACKALLPCMPQNDVTCTFLWRTHRLQDKRLLFQRLDQLCSWGLDG